MDFSHLFLNEKYLESMGWTLAHSIWQIALISLLLWFVLKLLPTKAANIRYGAAILALILVSSVSIWTFVHHLGIYEKNGSTISSPILVDKAPVQSATVALVGTANVQNTPSEPSLADFLYTQIDQHLYFLVNLWLIGVIFYLVKLGGSLYDLGKLHQQHHQRISPALLKKVESFSASLELFRKVMVLKSSIVPAPITYGLFKPVILLPISLTFLLTPAQLEAIIAHELAHIKRNDYLVSLFQSVLEVMFFFHPCFWWINGIIHEERENATDDLALSIGICPKDLAFGLAEVANYASYGPPEMTLAASSDKNRTLLRIKRILGKSTPSIEFSPLIVITMILTLVFSSLLMVGAQNPATSGDNNPQLLTHLKTVTIEIDRSLPYQLPPSVATLTEKDTVPAQKPAKPSKKEPMPSLDLTPVPEIDFDFQGMWVVPPVPPVSFDFSLVPPQEMKIQTDSIQKIVKELSKLQDEHSPESKAKSEALKSALAQVEKKMESLSRSFEVKVEDWEAKHGEAMEKFEAEMKEWEEKFKEQENAWEESFAPKMKEFEEKMKQWEKENEPKIKEFEEKMKQWHKENAGKKEKHK